MSKALSGTETPCCLSGDLWDSSVSVLPLSSARNDVTKLKLRICVAGISTFVMDSLWKGATNLSTNRFHTNVCRKVQCKRQTDDLVKRTAFTIIEKRGRLRRHNYLDGTHFVPCSMNMKPLNRRGCSALYHRQQTAPRTKGYFLAVATNVMRD